MNYFGLDFELKPFLSVDETLKERWNSNVLTRKETKALLIKGWFKFMILMVSLPLWNSCFVIALHVKAPRQAHKENQYSVSGNHREKLFRDNGLELSFKSFTFNGIDFTL